jgi:pSer/pThr/pTyr-binding forkhead associated (FHA) protein
MTTAKAPSGREIWQAVRDELRLNLYPLPFSTLAPTVYHVYLHPEDFATVEGIIPTIAAQIAQALTAEVERLNRDRDGRVRTIMARLLERERLGAIEVPAAGWEIHLLRDPDEELARGQIGIVSTLAMPAPVEQGGTPTTRIVRSVVGGGARSASVSDVATPAAASPAAGGAAAAGPATDARGPRDRARLVYQDDQGPHTFVMRKDAIAIGRGGSAVWVDVQVATSARVSREHLRIRYDASGRFFVQDVSVWGTTVDDVAIPPAVQGAEGVLQPGAEHPLPPRARIGLAGAIVLAFEALEA